MAERRFCDRCGARLRRNLVLEGYDTETGKPVGRYWLVCPSWAPSEKVFRRAFSYLHTKELA